MFDEDEYVLCQSVACNSSSDVQVYMASQSSPDQLDERTIFRISMEGNAVHLLANRQSLVHLAGGVFSFRNPPRPAGPASPGETSHL